MTTLNNELFGLDGGNPLAFLAALGLIKVIESYADGSSFKMSWYPATVGWRPVIYDSEKNALTKNDLIPVIEAWLKSENNKFSKLAGYSGRKKGKGTGIGIFQKSFRDLAEKSIVEAGSIHNTAAADLLVALGSETIATREKGCDDGPIESTALRATRSHEFIDFAANLEKHTVLKHIEKAVFEAWQYNDPVETHSMRWDPWEDSQSRYALRWDNPGDGNPERKKSGATWGANRLALEALSFFSTAAQNGKLETTGFSQRQGVLWTWPIWECPIGVETIQSILAHSELQQKEPRRELLMAMGIMEIYRCQRIFKDKYRNFIPAYPA